MFQTESYGNQVAQGGVGLGYRNISDAPPVNGRVTEAAQNIARAADQLHAEVSALEQRLSCVLRPAVPQASATQKSANITPSALAANLDEIHERLYGLLGYVQSLTARVDL